ncbi:hypothetical protein DdX_20149 [Ditylenchus destructor]|uniref:Uncharacterized protein n=1 Tax=Ditylenchus destructor TaxID=166010 RepID=A0AAD4MHN8_9BILA|nr:hypothetical protein DdX_20147 [Ditylenchus destructor]KAI1694365.1 hypothetical protein DdX_20149 [Ditylenchus destructor]
MAVFLPATASLISNILPLVWIAAMSFVDFHYSVYSFEVPEIESIIEADYKSSRVRNPSCKSNDRYGNIVLNGLMQEWNIEPFEFRSDIREESEYSITFCLQDEKLMCEERGLVVCFNSFDEKLPYQNLTSRQKYIAEQCDEMNGFTVSTKDRKIFRIDTRYGNTDNNSSYQLPIYDDEPCFILWLTYDLKMTKTIFDKYGHIGVNALSRSNEISDINGTNKPLEFQNNWSDVALNEKGKPNKMLWKETIVKPILDGKYSLAYMKASGGGICCALTGRLTGKHIQKCYYKWKRLGDTCRATLPGHKTECAYPYSVAHNITHTLASTNYSRDGFSREVMAFVKNITGNFTHIFVDKDLVNDAFSDTFRNSTQKWWTPGITHESLNLSGAIQATIGADLGIAEIKVSGEIAVKYYQKYLQATNESLTDVKKKQFLDKFHSTLKKKLSDKLRNETTRSKIKTYVLDRQTNSSHLFNYTFTEYRYENHTIRNLVEYPDELITKQLVYICMGEEIPTNVVEGFTDNKKVVERARKKERELGYPDYELQYECPL